MVRWSMRVLWAMGLCLASPPARADDPSRLAGAALAQVLPDLQNTSWPPPWRVIFAFGQRYPLQLIGLGIGGEGYVGDSLRLSVFYSPGVSVKGTTAIFSNYGQALAGVKLFGFWDRLEADARPRRPARKFDVTRPSDRVLEAWLPTYHAFLVEVGALTGVVPLKRCEENCPPSPTAGLESRFEWEIPHLVYPLAGVRYVFSLGAKSKSVPLIDRDFVLQVFGHAIFAPFFDSGHPLYWERNDEPVVRQVLGGEGGVSIPLCLTSCVRLWFTAGYLPAPATGLIELGVGG
jgi:hypothetical protein